MCQLRNVCWARGNFVFFRQDDAAPADVHLFGEGGGGGGGGSGLVATSYMFHNFRTANVEETMTRADLWSPAVAAHAMPPHWKSLFAPRPLYFLDSPGFADNFGHFLVEHVMSALAAAEAFGFDMAWTAQQAQLLLVHRCSLPGMLAGRRRRDVCRFHYERTLTAWMDAPVRYLEDEAPTDTALCFDRLITGHVSAFSLKYQYPRGWVLRRFRDLSYARLLPPLPHPQAAARPDEPARTEIVVVSKDAGYALTSVHWANGCAHTHAALASLRFGHARQGSEARVTCVGNIGSMSVREQMSLMASAHVILTEQGTTSYSSVFGRDGVAVIVVGRPPMKEAQILLQATHLQVLYHPVDQRGIHEEAEHGERGHASGVGSGGGGGGSSSDGGLPRMLMLALNLAAPAFALPRASMRQVSNTAR